MTETRDERRETRRAVLVSGPSSLVTLLFLAACATIQDPPGGPPDLAPPMLVSVAPDSASVLTDLGKSAVFQFNEVITEPPKQVLQQLIIVSPRAAALNVSWKRDAIDVKPKGGWRAAVPYQLTLMPGITDLRNNKWVTGRTVIFSTGGPIPGTHATGRAIDWEAGGAAARALIELTRLSDSLVFWGIADSVGGFTVSAVPPGKYLLSATIDRNNNRLRDYREPYDSNVVTLDSTLNATLWAFTHDSVGPRIRTVQRADSFAIRLEFNQVLAPGGPPAASVRVRSLPDSAPVSVAGVQSPAAFDSVKGQRQRDAAARDTTGVRAPVPAPAPAVRGAAAPVPSPGRPAISVAPGVTAGQTKAAPTDSTLIKLLATRPKLGTTWIVVLSQPLRPGSRYIINAAVPNASGAVGESSAVLVLPAEVVRKDSTRADTTRARP